MIAFSYLKMQTLTAKTNDLLQTLGGRLSIAFNHNNSGVLFGIFKLEKFQTVSRAALFL